MHRLTQKHIFKNKSKINEVKIKGKEREAEKKKGESGSSRTKEKTSQGILWVVDSVGVIT